VLCAVSPGAGEVANLRCAVGMHDGKNNCVSAYDERTVVSSVSNRDSLVRKQIHSIPSDRVVGLTASDTGSHVGESVVGNNTISPITLNGRQSLGFVCSAIADMAE